MAYSMSAGIKNCVQDQGWTIVGHWNTSRWRVNTEDEYGEEFAATNLIETFKEMADSDSNHFSRFNGAANTFMPQFSRDEEEEIVHIYLNCLLKIEILQCEQLQNCMRLLQHGQFVVDSEFQLNVHTRYYFE
jgi:hypothetical protein